MPDYTLSAKITADSKQFDTSIQSAGKNASDFNKKVSDSGKVSQIAKKTLAGVAGVVGSVSGAMAGALGVGIKYNTEIESYQTSFEVMTGSAEEAKNTIDELKKMGAETPFELPQLADTTQLLMNYGFTADNAIKHMSMLGDISQGNADKMNRIATAYGQMSSAGKVSLEDVKQMIEAGFNPLQEISESTGESMGSLYDRISKGTISVDEITSSMERATSAGGKYFQSMEKQSQTFKGQISTLKDNATQLLGELATSTSEEMTGDLLPTVNKGLSDMMSAFKDKGFVGMATVGGKLIANLVTGIVSKAPELIKMAFTMISTFLTGIQTNIPLIVTSVVELGTLLITNLLGMLPQIIQIGFDVIVSLAHGISTQLPTLIPTIINIMLEIVDTLTNSENLSMLIGVALELMFALAQGLINAMPKLASAVPIIIKNVTSTFIKLLPKLIPVALQLIITLATGMINYIPTLISYIPMIISAIIGAFAETDWGEIGKDIIKGLIEGLKSMLSNLKNAIGNVATSIADNFKKLLGIHSPSRVFMQYGVYTDEGYAIGIEKGRKEIYKQLDSLRIPETFAQSQLPSTSSISSTNTAPLSQTRTDMSGFGDYIVAVSTDQFSQMANALERGISGMRMTADGREVGRFVSNLGFAKARA